MTEVHFVHTQFKTDVVIYKEQVFAVTFAPMQKSVVVVAVGGAAVPVEGSIDEVRNKIQEAGKVAGSENNGVK